MRRNHKPGMSHLAVGLLVIGIALVGTYLGFSKDVPFINKPFEMHAVFESANNIRPNSPVRIAGVNIGKVTSIERVRAGAEAARVTMAIEDKGLPIRKDAVLRIRPRIFLEGNFFVDVQPGSASAPAIADGETIPINQTAAPVQLDQLLTALQSDTREDLKKLLAELGDGLEGEGAGGYNRSIPYWEPAYRDGAIVAQANLGTRPHDLSGYVRDAGAVAAALDRDPAALKGLVTDFHATVRAFAARDQKLQQAVAELPRTLRAAQPALAALNDAFPPLRAFVKDLRPAVRSSGPALQTGLPFVQQLRGLVSAAELRGLSGELRRVVPSLTKVSTRSVPLLEQNRLAASCTNEVILPWSKEKLEDAAFPATGPVYEDSIKSLVGLAGESRSGDANGQWFRVLVAGGTYFTPIATGQYLLTDTPVGGVNPPPPTRGRTPLRSDVACETQPVPDLRSRPMTLPGTRKATVPATGSGRKRYNELVDAAVDKVRAEVKARDLPLKVSSRPATRDTVARLKAQALRARRGGR